MKTIPSISEQISKDQIFKTVEKNFSTIAPYYYTLLTNWLISAYKIFHDIDKFVVLIYLINKDLIFFRKNGLVIDYDTFYKDKSLEIPKINISDISKDLKMPKESVRRKIQELEKKKIIKKAGKKIFIDRSAFIAAKADKTLKDFCLLISKLNEITIKENKNSSKVLNIDEISESIKKNFSFCWYQFYKFLFIFTTRWRSNVTDLETLTIGYVVLLNTIDRPSFKTKDLNRKSFQKLAQGYDERGVNAMSISDITGIPRPTVVRKIKYLVENDFLHINQKKLITLDMRGKTLTDITKLQDLNMLSLSDLLYRIFNQIKVSSVNNDNKEDNFIPSYLRGFN